jgi:hypothetical protein
MALEGIRIENIKETDGIGGQALGSGKIRKGIQFGGAREPVADAQFCFKSS